MKKLNLLSSIANILIVLLSLTFVSCERKITMKALILSSENKDNVAGLVLQSYGIPYDMFTYGANNLPQGNLTLVDADGQPKYNLVVLLGGSLSYEDKTTGLWVSSFTDAQWAHLYEYESNFGVREVSIDDTVKSTNYVQLYISGEWGRTTEVQPLRPADNADTQAVYSAADVKLTAPLNVDGIYHTRVNITNSEYVKPFLYYEENGANGAVAATISKFPNGREKMSFYFAFGSWAQTSIMLNHLWLAWGTRSLYNGFRRVYFTPHIDDVFLSSDLVDPVHNILESENNEIYRTTRDDYKKIAQFQKNVLDIMPAGSLYRVELAFNGNGILIAADPEQALEIDGERYCELEFVKPPGTGDERWEIKNYNLTFAESFYKKDDLYVYFANNEEAQKEFFWSSHTFSHENLDNASRSDVDNEIRVNIDMAEKLGLIGKEYFSEHAIITPQISGLRNKDAIEVFKQYGINAGTGDLSRPLISNQENPYLPFYTTLESSNYEGFPIIPRTPTEIYYLCSKRDENTWMYNYIYRSHFGRNSTWEEISERESKRTLLLMTKLRHEAHQFHQANLRYYPTEGNYGNSLLEDWTRAVVNLYTQYVDWPLISLKIDDIMDSFVRRADLEACHPISKLILNDDLNITGISVTATEGACTVPITVPGGINEGSLPSGTRLEQIGNDPLTVWIDLEKNETKSIELFPSLSWGGNMNITLTN